MAVDVSRRGDILDVRDAAYVLKVRPSAVLDALERDDLPARRISGEWRFEREALKNWLGEGSSVRYAPLFAYHLTAFNIEHHNNVAHWRIC